MEPGVVQEMPDLEIVYSLISSLYKPDVNNVNVEESISEASKKLEQIQKSIFGWQIADKLLINARDYDSCYFAAQTLKTKTRTSFAELPKESYESLKESVLNHILKMNEKPILTQLSLSLSYIFFGYLDWNDPIGELSRRLPHQKFVQVLINIGREYNYQKNEPLIPYSRSQQLKKMLAHYFTSVYELLKNSFDVTNKQSVREYFECLKSWTTVSEKEHLTQIREFITNIFVFLRNPTTREDIHEIVADSLSSIIITVECSGTFPEIMSELYTEIVGLESSFDLTIESEDQMKIMSFCTIFTELGISMLDYIVNEQVDSKVLDLILKCTAYHDFDVVEMTFNFWSEFSLKVIRLNSHPFKRHFYSLLTALSTHSALDEDLEKTVVIDDDYEEYYFRGKIPEIIEDVIGCCDWVEYIKTQKVLENLVNTNEWNTFEANIFVLTAMISGELSLHNEGRNEVLPDMVNLVLQLLESKKHLATAQVFATSCDLLAELRHWINENSDFLQPVIQFLLTLIQTSFKTCPKLTSRACKPLKMIFVKMERFSDFDTMRNLFSCLETCYIQVENMQNDLSVSLMAVMTSIISNPNFSTLDQQEDFVERVIQLFLAKMTTIMNTKDLASVNRDQWQNCIDNIYAIFKGFQPNKTTKNSQKIHELLKNQIWPFLRVSIHFFNKIDSHTIEHCSRCLRHIIRSMKPAYFLEPIINEIVPLYAQNPENSPLIYVGAVLVSEFGNEVDQNLAANLIQMLNAFSSTTFQLFNQNKYQDYPDTIADFFNLCSKTLLNLTENFLNNTETLNGILNLSLVAVDLITTEALEARTKFLINFFSTTHPIVAEFLTGDFGKQYVFSTVNALLFTLPSRYAPDLIDTLWHFKMFQAECFQANFRECVNQLIVKAQSEGYNVRNEQLEEFYTSMVNANNPKRMISQSRTIQRMFKP